MVAVGQSLLAVSNRLRRSFIQFQLCAHFLQTNGDYARAKVTPNDTSQTDAAWVFLKREKGVWRGLTKGTAFSPEDYKNCTFQLLFSSKTVRRRWAPYMPVGVSIE
jgi:hypothetical protein